MTELPFNKQSFDLIWAEGCAYIMGVTNALKEWKPLLQDNGILMISDAVWLTQSPNREVKSFWTAEYPDIQTVGRRLDQIKQAGYEVLTHFTISDKSWHNYYQPLEIRLKELELSMQDSQALRDIEKEISIYRQYLGEFSYQMFILKKPVNAENRFETNVRNS